MLLCQRDRKRLVPEALWRCSRPSASAGLARFRQQLALCRRKQSPNHRVPSSERARAPEVGLEARIGLAQIVHPSGKAQKRHHGFGKPGASGEVARGGFDMGEMDREPHFDADRRGVHISRHRFVARSLLVFVGRVEQAVAKAPFRPQCETPRGIVRNNGLDPEPAAFHPPQQAHPGRRQTLDSEQAHANRRCIGIGLVWNDLSGSSPDLSCGQTFSVGERASEGRLRHA